MWHGTLVRHFISLLSKGAGLGFVKAPLPDLGQEKRHRSRSPPQDSGRWLEWDRPLMRSLPSGRVPPSCKGERRHLAAKTLFRYNVLTAQNNILSIEDLEVDFGCWACSRGMDLRIRGDARGCSSTAAANYRVVKQ